MNELNLDRSISDLHLTPRTENTLRWEDILIVGDLIGKNMTEILMLPNFGRKSLIELEAKIKEIGLSIDSKNNICLLPTCVKKEIFNNSVSFSINSKELAKEIAEEVLNVILKRLSKK